MISTSYVCTNSQLVCIRDSYVSGYQSLAAKTISNGKYGTLNYTDLGSAVIANYSMTSYADNAKPTENKYGAYSLTDPNYGNYPGCTQNSLLVLVVQLRNTYPCLQSMV